MYYERIKDCILIENILKIPEIYQGFDPYNKYPREYFTLDRNCKQIFFICFIDEKPASILIIDKPTKSVNIHFAVLPEFRHLSKELFFKGASYLKKRYTQLTKIVGKIPTINQRSFNFFKKVGAKVKQIKNRNYQMELEI